MSSKTPARKSKKRAQAAQMVAAPLAVGCYWCDGPAGKCTCASEQEATCRGCDWPENACKCHLIDMSEGAGAEPIEHICGDWACPGDCGKLPCGCWDKCKGKCGRTYCGAE